MPPRGLNGQQQSITLTNIPPGQYKLTINYTNENGDWSTHPKVLMVIVTPPFWQMAWAYAFYVLLILAVQIAIVLYIRRRTRTKKAMAIEKFKALQLKELNDYKLQFFTNIAHEFRTPLTLILGPVASLIHTNITSLITRSILSSSSIAKAFLPLRAL